MIGTRAALRYAKATLNLAKEKKMAEEVNKDMILIRDTLEENHDLEIMLKSPVIKSASKRSVLIEIFKKEISDITKGLIDVLIENKRLSLLPLVAKEYIVIYDFMKGVEVAQITTASGRVLDLRRQVTKLVVPAVLADGSPVRRPAGNRQARPFAGLGL